MTEFLLTNIISFFAFEHLPHIQDSVAQVFHGKIFAAGRLTAPSPPLRDFFYYQHMINNGQWYSQYPPGHSFLMMLGVLAGAPWLVNPLLGSATIVLLYFLGREIYSDAIGRLAAVLGLFSPFILFMSSEFMNHTTALFLFTAFLILLCTDRAPEKHGVCNPCRSLPWLDRQHTALDGSDTRAAVCPACLLSFMAAVQALQKAVSRAVACGIWCLWRCCWHLTISPTAALWCSATRCSTAMNICRGFGHAAWGEAHTLGRGIRNTLNNFVGLNKYLFEWPIPSLIFVFMLFASGKTNRWDRLLFFSFLCLAGGYLFYWFQDWCFGPRFLYEAAGIMILLTARGIQSLPHLIKTVLKRAVSVRRLYGLTTAVLVFCTLYALASNVPALYKVYSSNYWEVNTKLFSEVEQQGVGKALIFTRHFFGCLLMANSPFLDNDVIYVVDSGALNKKMMALYPGYRYFIAQGDSIEEIFPE